MRAKEDIKSDVVDSLYWDNRVDAGEVTVQVEDGAAILGGSVPSYRARYAAEEDARLIRGVTEVRNDIVVRFPSTFVKPTDGEIHDDVRDSLSLDPDVDDADIGIAIDGGWVVLRGTVPTLWQKDLAEDLALTSRGVIGADNELAVVPTKDVDDQLIADDIVAELERRVLVDPTDIDVTVANGYVTLRGIVPNWRARNAAYYAARYTLGVVDVIDDLAITAT